jgi:mono/diheme cytochrome c family protein
MKSGLIVALAIPALVAVAAGSWYVLHGDRAEQGGAPDPARIAQGKAVYDTHCASCHGLNLEGEAGWQNRRPDGTLPAPPQDETGHTWHHPDQQLIVIIRDGIQAVAGPEYISNMKAFGDALSDDEIRAVLDYIKSRWPDRVRAMQAEMTRKAGGG